MASEIGTIQIESNKKEHIEEVLKIYNSFMDENASTERDDISEEDIELVQLEGFPEYYTFEEDCYGLFDDPMDTCLFELAKKLIMTNPSFQFSIVYEMSWDNSGETWSEEYNYEDKTLRMETVFDSDSEYDDFDDDDEDEDDEDYSDELSENAQVTNRLFKLEGNELIEQNC